MSAPLPPEESGPLPQPLDYAGRSTGPTPVPSAVWTVLGVVTFFLSGMAASLCTLATRSSTGTGLVVTAWVVLLIGACAGERWRWRRWGFTLGILLGAGVVALAWGMCAALLR